jgi:hypothetical protein
MVCRSFVILCRERALKTQPGSAHNIFKGPARHNHDVVTPALQGPADANKRMNITARSHGSQDKPHALGNSK